MNQSQQVAGIVLCGGQSRRMGRSKALLPFGPELLLERVVRILTPIVQPIVVVSAADQPLPALNNVRLAVDREPSRGPLEGLAAGMEAIGTDAIAAYVTSCDVPLLMPEFVQRLISMLDDFDAVVPVEGDLLHSLAAVYRTNVLPIVRQLLADNRLRPAFLFDHVKTKRVDVNDLRAVDPDLKSLVNVNHWEEYLAALTKSGFEPPLP